MKKTTLAMVAAAVITVGCAVQAGDQAPGGAGMARMDSNSDGKVSKNEFLSFHEKMWDGFQKNPDGSIDANVMMRHEGMMQGPGMMPGQGMMQGGPGPTHGQGMPGQGMMQGCPMQGAQCVMRGNQCVMQGAPVTEGQAAESEPSPEHEH